MRAYLLALALLPLAVACSSVDRVDPNTVTDLSGDWNDTDARLTAEEMIVDCLQRPWLPEYRTSHQGAKPIVIVGTVKNRTNEHIAVSMFTKDWEKQLLNSGLVRFVAAKGERDEVRDEREDQQMNSSAESMKRMRQETGADFMLIGSIDQVNDSKGRKTAKVFQVNMELVNMESNEKVWIGSKDIKKMVKKAGLGF